MWGWKSSTKVLWGLSWYELRTIGRLGSKFRIASQGFISKSCTLAWRLWVAQCSGFFWKKSYKSIAAYCTNPLSVKRKSQRKMKCCFIWALEFLLSPEKVVLPALCFWSQKKSQVEYLLCEAETPAGKGDFCCLGRHSALPSCGVGSQESALSLYLQDWKLNPLASAWSWANLWQALPASSSLATYSV